MHDKTFKVLAQARPAAGVLTDIYQVPVGKEAIITHTHIFNRNNLPTTFRLSIGIDGVPSTPASYLYHDAAIQGNTADGVGMFPSELTLSENDIIRFSSVNGDCTIHLFGSEGDVES